MSHNIAGMPPFARMPLGGMGMGVGMGPNVPHPEPNAHPHPPPPPPAGANPKKKRRTNTNVAPPQPQPAPTVQDLLPPPLSGFGDTIIASNPFDDAPQQNTQNQMMHGGPPLHMHSHHPHHMSGPPMRGMSPLAPMGGMSPMMPMGNMSPMGNSPMGNHINHMGGMSPMSHAPMGGMSPMNNMGQNIGPQGPMNTMNNHMNMSHINNQQMSGPSMGSPMNNINSGPMGSPMNNMGHNLGSPMGGGMGSPMNNMPGNNHNHMQNGPININNMNNHMTPNSPLNGPTMNNVNTPLNHNGSQQPHQNHMGGNNLNNLGRSINGPMSAMNSMVSNNMNMSGGPNSMNNMNMNGPPMNNMTNMNMPHPNQMGHMGGGPGGPGGPNNNINNNNNNNNNSNNGGAHSGPGNNNNHNNNNMSGGLPMGHQLGGNMPPHGFQGPGMGPKPMPVSAGKIYPIDQSKIFNSQNPNAPPIYPCGSCHKEVHDNDQGILCESGCNFWYHRACSGLSEIAFQLLTNEVYAEWVCDKCLHSKDIPLIKCKP